MKKNYTKFLFFFLFILANQIFAQDINLWLKVDEVKIANTLHERKVNIKNYQTYKLNADEFREVLKNAPFKDTDLKISRTILQFPDYQGNLISFKIKESPVMHPLLAEDYPNNKSYIGIDENGVTIRFSLNELGLHGMIISRDRKVQYIDPIAKSDDHFKIYDRKDLELDELEFQCLTAPLKTLNKIGKNKFNSATDLKLRTYRLALAGTGEYSQFHINEAGASSGTEEEQKAVVMAAMTVAITRINAVFENDLAVRFQIVPANDDIIYLDPDTDPYTNDDGNAMLNENQTTCDNVIGSSNYDIGHVLSTAGGGVASLGSICENPDKAKGATGSVSPTGENFYFDFIAHEFGHQLGASHSYNGDSGLCGGGNRNDDTAYEPGSGSSLMGYAGLCAPQNVQAHSDLYFHAISIDEIWTNISADNCGVKTDLINNLNVPTVNAGDNFTIPVSTPYKLTGQGDDADGDQITYCWEQFNNEINSVPPIDTDTDGTIYRSYVPTVDPFRYFPELNTVVSGSLSSKWEVTPSVARDMDFILSVRDNNIEAGQVVSDMMTVSVTEAAGPFQVTSQNVPDLVWDKGTSETISWDVAGTTGNGINTSQVNILLSIDGGQTFSIVLATNTPNDGIQNITVPDQLAPSCRIMVEAVDNVYYSVNNEPFSLGTFVTECVTIDSADVPKNIPDDTSTGVVSTITVNENDVLTDIRVSVEITHTWIADIRLVLENPQGTTVELIAGECFGLGNEDMNATFDDLASALVCGSTAPVISGSIKPVQELANFINESPMGVWKLKVIDEGPDDIGTLEQWSLEICTSRPLPVSEFGLDNFELYPNPTEGLLNIAFKLNHEKVDIRLYDLLGRKIKEFEFLNSSFNFNETIELLDVSSGIYLLEVRNNNRFSTSKISIK